MFSKALLAADRDAEVSAIEWAAVAVADPDMATRPALDFEAGYVQRALGELPRQGEADDWRMSMSYFEDAKRLNSELSFGEESGLRLSSSKHAKVTV